MAVQTPSQKTSSQAALPGLKLYNTNRRSLELLAEFFCLRTNHIAELIRGREANSNDKRSIRQTLKVLLKAGVVERLPYLDLDHVTGGVHYAWGLTDKGVKFVKPLWPLAKTFDEHSQRTLDHELEISFFHMALKKFATSNNLKLYWQQSDLKCTISPDVMFALTDPARSEGKNILYYFLEMERAKSGHYVNGEPSIMHKLGKYYEYYGTDKCEKEWLDFRQFRVIVIQRTNDRRENLLKELATQQTHKNDCAFRNGRKCNCDSVILNHRMFWLATEASFKEDIGGSIFKTPKDFETTAYSFLAV